MKDAGEASDLAPEEDSKAVLEAGGRLGVHIGRIEVGNPPPPVGDSLQTPSDIFSSCNDVVIQLVGTQHSAI